MAWQKLFQTGECNTPLLWSVQMMLQVASVVQSNPAKDFMHKPGDQSRGETRCFPEGKRCSDPIVQRGIEINKNEP